MKNKRGNVAVIAITVVIVAITVGIVGWMFTSKSQVPTQQSITNQSANQKQRANSSTSETQQQNQSPTNQATQSSDSVSASSDWARYKESTISEIKSENSHLMDSSGRKDSIYIYNAKSLDSPYKVRLAYKNEYRKLSPQKMEFLKNWKESLSIETDFIKLFENESLFTDGTREYWIPIQKQLVPFLKKEVGPDDSVELFIMWPGAYLESSVFDWVFLINEFNAQ